MLEAAERPLIARSRTRGRRTWLDASAPDAGIELRTNQRMRDVGVRRDGRGASSSEGGAAIRGAGGARGRGIDPRPRVARRLGTHLDRRRASSIRISRRPSRGRDRGRGAVSAPRRRWARSSCASSTGRSRSTTPRSSPVTGSDLEARSHGCTVPYFWSDQYGKKIQMLGHPDPSDDVTLRRREPRGREVVRALRARRCGDRHRRPEPSARV